MCVQSNIMSPKKGFETTQIMRKQIMKQYMKKVSKYFPKIGSYYL